ncbi:unnamed protein product [Sphagnum jensenii]|uniref:Uncharacterized protein n=1 Tax=Sphagnum jensenii TaxID=128206 RepID=A0ABP0VJ16_9BRYO
MRPAATFNIEPTAVIADEARGPTNGIAFTTEDMSLTKVLIVGRSPVNNGTMDDRAEAKELAVPAAAEIKP